MLIGSSHKLEHFPVQCGVEALKARLSQLSATEQRVAVYLLLHSLLGERPDEHEIYDPEGFLYMCLLPLGVREHFRRLEDPSINEELAEAAKGPTIPHEEFWKELGIEE